MSKKLLDEMIEKVRKSGLVIDTERRELRSGEMSTLVSFHRLDGESKIVTGFPDEFADSVTETAFAELVLDACGLNGTAIIGRLTGIFP